MIFEMNQPDLGGDIAPRAGSFQPRHGRMALAAVPRAPRPRQGAGIPPGENWRDFGALPGAKRAQLAKSRARGNRSAAGGPSRRARVATAGGDA